MNKAFPRNFLTVPSAGCRKLVVRTWQYRETRGTALLGPIEKEAARAEPGFGLHGVNTDTAQT